MRKSEAKKETSVDVLAKERVIVFSRENISKLFGPTLYRRGIFPFLEDDAAEVSTSSPDHRRKLPGSRQFSTSHSGRRTFPSSFSFRASFPMLRHRMANAPASQSPVFCLVENAAQRGFGWVRFRTKLARALIW